MRKKRQERVQTPAEDTPSTAERPVARAAFRFAMVYLGFFSLSTQIAGSFLPLLSFRGFGPLWPMREVTTWVSQRVLGINLTPVYIDPRVAGETVHYWIQSLWLLIAAAFVTGVWSAVDKNSRADKPVYSWFRVFVRLGLAAQMLEYGMTKVIPTQFPPPSLNTLVTPVGNVPLSNLLWTSIGAAPLYGTLTGCAELLAAALLIWPATTLIGALICLADLGQVFALNLSYDIGLKLTTFHLILLTLFLLAPDARKLWDFLVLRKAAEPSREPVLLASPAMNRAAAFVQLAFGVYLICSFTYVNLGYFHAAGSGSPRSVLYGIWDLEELSIDGEVRSSSTNDYDRQWRRLIFDAPDSAVFQRLDDSFARYIARFDGDTLNLTRSNSRNWQAKFTFVRPTPERLLLDGEMDGYRIQATFTRVEFDTFRLLNSNFRWMYPPEP